MAFIQFTNKIVYFLMGKNCLDFELIFVQPTIANKTTLLVLCAFHNTTLGFAARIKQKKRCQYKNCI